MGRLSDPDIARLRQEITPVECCAGRGGVLLMHPLLLDASSPAAAPDHRRVIHIEYAAQPLPDGLRWYEEPAQESHGTASGK